MSPPVPITLLRSGGRVVVAPTTKAVRSLLVPQLTYLARKIYKGPEGRQRRALGLPLVEEYSQECYGFDHKERLFTVVGFVDRITALLKGAGHSVRLCWATPAEAARAAELAATVYQPDWSRIFYPGEELRQRQDEALVALAAYECGRIDCPPGWGKAQPVDALVQTPYGPKRMGDLTAGDEVCGPSGDIRQVLAVHKRGVLPTWRVTFATGDVVECCDDHLWRVHAPKRGWRSPRIVSTRYLRERMSASSRQRDFTVAVPLASSGHSRLVPLPPYLLGVLLGDGHFSRGGTVGLTSADEDLVAYAQSLLDPVYWFKRARKYHYTLVRRVPEYRPIRNAYAESIAQLGLRGCGAVAKFVPSLYLHNDRQVRLEVLRGLLDTDGTVGKAGTVRFYTVSPQLAQDVKYLVESLGGLCGLSTKKAWYTYKGRRRRGKLCWVCRIEFDDSSHVFRLERKKVRCVRRTKYLVSQRIVSITPAPAKPMRCITVDAEDGLYLTDHHIVTHNSAVIRKACQLFYRARFAVVADSVTVLHQRLYPELCLHLPDVGCIGGGKRSRPHHRVMCCTADSLDHLKDYHPHFVLVDEGHQAAADEFARRLAVFGFEGARLWGFSASWDMRWDNRNMRFESIFGPVRLRVGYDEAQAAGMVVPIRVLVRDVVLDYDPGAGLVDEDKERACVWANPARNALVAADAAAYPGRVVLVTCRTVEHVFRLKQLLPAATVVYADVLIEPARLRRFQAWGILPADFTPMTTARRQRIVRWLERGRPGVYLATPVLNVGVDLKYLDVVVRAEASGSRELDTQVPGRVSRLRDGKEVGLVHDYLDQFQSGYRTKARGRVRSYLQNHWEVVHAVTGQPLD